MRYKPIVIVAGEPNSVFSELFIKTLKKKKIQLSNNSYMFKKTINKTS